MASQLNGSTAMPMFHTISRAIGATLLALGLVLTLGCREKEYATVAEDTILGTPPGALVDLEGDVERVYPDGFRLDPEAGLINASGVLVILPEGEIMPPQGSEVRVTGEVREVTVAELENDFGFDWTSYEVDFEEEKIVLAEAVRITELID